MKEAEFHGYVQRALEDNSETLKRIEDKIDTQNGRIRKLENWRAYLIGIFTVVAFLVSVAVKFLL